MKSSIRVSGLARIMVFMIRYHQKLKTIPQTTCGRANVTAAAIKAGYTWSDVDPGEVTAFQVQAKVKANGKKRVNQTLRIGAKSATDARADDLAKGKLKGIAK